MTYCVGIITRQGLVMGSDSRTNAGYDQVNVCKKMHTFVQPGERVFILTTSGSFYEAARVVGETVRRLSDLDREALERDEFRFNLHVLIGGQIRGEPPALYLIYPQGNPIRATEDSPFLQIGESKYGRPILDRGIRYEETSLEDAAKYTLISFDSTMRSNATVGPPIDLAVYTADELVISRQRRFLDKDPDLQGIHRQWERALRRAMLELPEIQFDRLPEQERGQSP
jgi:putative proteasome-type protease